MSPHGKQAIVDDLGKVFLLEIECMGVPFHERMKRLDTKLLQTQHNNNTKLEAEYVLPNGPTIYLLLQSAEKRRCKLEKHAKALEIFGKRGRHNVADSTKSMGRKAG